MLQKHIFYNTFCVEIYYKIDKKDMTFSLTPSPPPHVSFGDTVANPRPGPLLAPPSKY